MADYGFISHPAQSNGLSAIRDMLGIAGAAQNMARGNISLQKERGLLQPEIDRAKAESRVAQETADPRISTAQSVAQRADTEAKQAAFGLTRDQATAALNEAAGLFKDPRITGNNPTGIVDALVEARKRMVAKGVPEHMAETMTAELLADAHKPGAVLNRLQGIVQANAGSGTQAAVLNAPLSPVSTGQRTTFQQLQPGAPNAAQPGQYVQNELPPTTPTFNAGTNTPGYLGPQPPGARPTPQSGPTLGVQADIAASQEHTNQTRQAADQIPTVRNINREILKLSPDTRTGPGTQQWQNALGGLLAPFGVTASNYQELGKYLEQNAIRNMQAMGGAPSDARLAAAVAANGSTAFNPEALQAVTKFNDATARALAMYREGLDKAVGTESPNFNAVPSFRSAWTKNLDIDVFRYANALENKDPKEIDKILGKKGTEERQKRAAELADKWRALSRLSQGQ